jgi:glycerol-3-phosphate dehydrogenase
MVYDLFIIGGGIHGAGIACDAAGRGLSVYLSEMNDFASGTSSKSTKLIHGGLRYLEQYHFHLVKKSLKERDILCQKAPHLIYPMSFIVPFHHDMRPWWQIRLGLFVYDHLTKTRLSKTSTQLDLPDLAPLKENFSRGFKYQDCWVDDARLVIANLLQARALSAEIHNYQQVTHATCKDGLWSIVCFNRLSQQTQTIQAKKIINATGVFADKVRTLLTHQKSEILSLVKGSHLILPKCYEGEQAYLLQSEDKRVIFVIPMVNFIIVGTTEVLCENPVEQVNISDHEIDYLLAKVNAYFKRRFEKSDIIDTYSGLRPLVHDLKASVTEVNRDYLILEDSSNLIHVFGGKLTTYRQLAESVVNQLSPETKPWTAEAKLIGGEFEDFSVELNKVYKTYDRLPKSLLKRYFKQYGTLVYRLLENTTQLSDLGIYFGGDLYQREVDYLIQDEFVQTIEDILWRRTKTGLYLTALQRDTLKTYLRSLSLPL